MTHLLIFTRYPTPGTTKTRLIPALGATGAAVMQRQMTEHTVAQAIAPTVAQINGPQQPSLSASLHYTGGSHQQMRTWLGPDHTYLPQASGELGDRLIHAFEYGFQTASQVMAIGIDCPGLDHKRLQGAAAALADSDAVLGPADDGGYYLIGLKKGCHANWRRLFQQIDWGSDRVFGQTQAALKALGLTYQTLPLLTDVDYPTDLTQWQAVSTAPVPETTETLSIIIPVLNEAPHIQRTLATLRQQTQEARGVEIIVVDGGSDDHTIELVRASGVKLIGSPPGRAQQMNAGAAIASGNILLFLHGDTHLPKRFITRIRQTLPDQPSPGGPVAGAFSLKIQGEQLGLRLVEWGVRWRSRLGLPYGDQALFVRSDCFRALGGFADLQIMEDFELVRRLQRQGKITILPEAVATSARRWETLGIVRTTLINQLVVLGYLLGVPPAALHRWYRQLPPPSSRALEDA
ncbi:MAG: TIGR04283 family arsenosugar biosynthesis glycosyltransferase [Cyanobacteria bacterium P01_A01_bin.135]